MTDKRKTIKMIEDHSKVMKGYALTLTGKEVAQLVSEIKDLTAQCNKWYRRLVEKFRGNHEGAK